jgi:hypothetical protein
VQHEYIVVIVDGSEAWYGDQTPGADKDDAELLFEDDLGDVGDILPELASGSCGKEGLLTVSVFSSWKIRPK